jgi:hypothetical protein
VAFHRLEWNRITGGKSDSMIHSPTGDVVGLGTDPEPYHYAVTDFQKFIHGVSFTGEQMTY